MGGVVGTLLGFWCRGGCSTATVAAALTFFPPESTYDIVENSTTGETEWRIDPIFEPEDCDNVKVTLLLTSKKETIPGLVQFCLLLSKLIVIGCSIFVYAPGGQVHHHT
jgi:hypothetical protein